MKKRKNSFQSSGPRNLVLMAFFLAGCVMLLTFLTENVLQKKEVSYSSFLQSVESDQIKSMEVAGQDVEGVFVDGSQFETVIAPLEKNWELFKQHGIDVIVKSPSSQLSLWHLLPLFSLVLVMAMAFYFFRQSKSGSGGGGGTIFSMGKSKARLFMPSTIKETFASVAGAHEAKEELQDVVEFLKDPERFSRLGAVIPRGVLLVGEPGNGKTLLAKAVAGEANCPFFSVSGSDFIEVFVGVGAARVRDLFAQARKNAPCIIFIDEIDAVGRHRGSGMGGGHDEREQTLNQLLTEMDGFQTVGGSAIVIAATNRPDVLDKALLRPGRFDSQVEVPYPDLKSREQILKVHAKGVKIDVSVDLQKIARGTPGFTGADLKNLINGAAILATKEGADTVKTVHFEQASDNLLLGKERVTMQQTPEDLKVTAYHESGHALIRLLLPESTDPLHKITIVPRGRALGVAHSLPEREKYTQSKEEMLSFIMVAAGGRAAEEMIYHTRMTGPHDDFRKASEVARKMVCLYGMSDALGPVVYVQHQGSHDYSEKTAEMIDAEVRRIVQECYDKALVLLQDNKDKLDTLAHTLLEKETLYAGEIYELLDIEPRIEHTFK